MTRMTLAAAAAMTLAWAAAMAQGAPPDGIIREDMTEAEVQQSIGREPDVTQQRECGANTGHPWPCVIWVYTANNGSALAIYFRYDDGQWIVNSWRVRYAGSRP